MHVLWNSAAHDKVEGKAFSVAWLSAFIDCKLLSGGTRLHDTVHIAVCEEQ